MSFEFVHPYLGRKYREGEGENKEVPVTFTQEQLNEILAKEKRKHQDAAKKLEAELAKMKSAGADVAPLQAKVEELTNALLTKEELANKKAEELQTQFQTQVEQEKVQRAFYEKQYQNLLLKNEVHRAAHEHDAWDAEQLETLLAPKTKITPDLDKEGKPTGSFKVLAQVTVDGKNLEMPLVEAVGHMRSDKRYANQFKVKGSPGTGLTLNTQPVGQSGDGNPDFKDSAATLKWFQEQRKQGKISY
jgi:hypothetical protein